MRKDAQQSQVQAQDLQVQADSNPKFSNIMCLSPKHFGNHKVIDLETRNKSPGVSHVGLGVPKPVLAGVS